MLAIGQRHHTVVGQARGSAPYNCIAMHQAVMRFGVDALAQRQRRPQAAQEPGAVDRGVRLRVEDAEESKIMLIEALENKPGLPRDIVCLNAGAALYVAGSADSIAQGIDAARIAIASGDARAKLEHFIATTQTLAAS